MREGVYLYNIDECLKEIGDKRTKEEFREELIPLYLYSQIADSKGDMDYQLVIGNQPFDAIVFNNGSGKRMEFTEYIDGKQINDDIKKLLKEHIIDFEVDDCFSSEEKYLEMYENLVRKKQSKIYDNTLIIFAVSPFHLNFISNDEIGRIVVCLINIVKKYDFGTNNVSLMVKHSGNLTWGTTGEIYEIY